MATGYVCNYLTNFLCSPHRQLWWYCSMDSLQVYHEQLDGYYEIYKLPIGVVITWQTHYFWWALCIDPHTGKDQTLASIDRIDEMHIKLQFKAT